MAEKLTVEEPVEVFASRLKELSQEDVVRVAMSSLNKLLVKKGIVTQLELQQSFLDEAELQVVKE